ncbi:hypothetical protein BKI52_13000 [marine bacterium AO1-C]|nr:hypothetical protein BKI52_13000 [marine bacterium AO1-C]
MDIDAFDNVQFSLFDVLLLIGMTQGLVTSIFLLRSKHNVRSNRFLALAIITLCLLSAKRFWHTSGLWDTPYIRFFPNAGEVVIAPLIYFFLVFLLNSNLKFTWKKALHFLPFAVFQIYALVVYFATLKTQNLIEKDFIAGLFYFSLMKDIEEYLGVISSVVYILMGVKKLKSYRVWLNNTNADSAYPDFNWLSRLFTLCFILGAFLFLNHFLNIAFDFNRKYSFHWDAFNIYMAFVVYYLGFVGYKQSHIEIAINQTQDVKPSTLEIPKEEEQKEEEKLAQILENAMIKDKLFLNPTLSLKEVSDILEVNQRSLSQAINQHFQKSFREVINEYRIEEVKTKLNDENLKKQSILGIAMDCGFNSEASFYRIFKKSTGMSPSKYKDQQNAS